MSSVDAFAAVADRLTCPVCARPLRVVERRLGCSLGHWFDRARQGHVTLTAGTALPAADTASMVQARESFHAAGHYRPLADRLAELSKLSETDADPTDLVVDVGAGTGQLLARVLDRRTGAFGLAVDSSPYALRRAARAHQRAAAIGCDIWSGLPVRDGVASVVLNVFAPRNGTEFRRILRSGGVLLVVTPATTHLQELRSTLGLLQVDPHKQDRLDTTFAASFCPPRTEELALPLRLSHEDTHALVGMSPNAHHLSVEELRARIHGLPEPVPATAAFVISTYLPA